MSASVVRIIPAIETAFSSAERVTLAGSMMPLEHVVVLAREDVVAGRRSWGRGPSSTTTEPSFAGVLGELAQRLLERPAEDVDADRLVAVELDACRARMR